jgi:hypothetical protein
MRRNIFIKEIHINNNIVYNNRSDRSDRSIKFNNIICNIKKNLLNKISLLDNDINLIKHYIINYKYIIEVYNKDINDPYYKKMLDDINLTLPSMYKELDILNKKKEFYKKRYFGVSNDRKYD